MKRSILKVIPILAITLIASSCGTVGSRISGEYKFSQNDKLGLVAISSVIIDKCGSVGGFNSFIRNVKDTGGGTPLIAKNFLMSPDIKNPYGHFFVFELPAGSYTITNASVTGFTLAARYSKKNSGINFSVNTNKIIYVGEVEYTVNADCNSYGTRLNNKWKRDRVLFSKRVPNINPNSVKILNNKRI